jgi:protein-tyrosine phosphatase
MQNRLLDWPHCKNVRDLGGLRALDGRVTRFGAIVRADTPSRLSETGWAALYAYGVRTIVSLRTHGLNEPELDVHPPYADIAVARVEIEDVTDPEFRQKWASSDMWCTPLYYADAIQRWPQRHAAAISAIAQAGPGGVLFHCARGVDRTGIISLLLLSLAGVRPEDILTDYELSEDPEREVILAREHSSVPEAVLGALAGLEVESYLLAGGASRDDLSAIRGRLLGDAGQVSLK